MTDGRTGTTEHHGHEEADVDAVMVQRGKRQYYVGIALLLVVVVLWTSSSFLTQDLLEDGYDKPFLITYLNTSAFVLYLLPWLFRRHRGRILADVSDATRHGYEAIAISDALESSTSPVRSNFRSASIALNDDQRSLKSRVDDMSPLSTKDTARLASVFCFFWFIANWSVNASLDYTTVASSTILSSMSGFFTLGIGRIFKVEMFTVGKIVAVVTSFIGVVFVSLSDSSTSSMEPLPPHSDPPVRPHLTEKLGPIAGDLLALLSALFYALYVTLLKVRIKEESRIDMQLFFGFVGLFNVLLLWPIGIILHATGMEPLEWPHGGRAWAAVLINMLFTLSSDYIYVIAMLKTTPLVVTVGLSLTIPLAIIGDLFLNVPTALQAIFGASLVLISFVVVGMEDSKTRIQEVAGYSDDLDLVDEGDIDMVDEVHAVTAGEVGHGSDVENIDRRDEAST